MDKVIKEQWIAALRSGEYKQGKHNLCRGDRYCCLGVLCELAAKEGICKKGTILSSSGESRPSYDSSHQYLPPSVMKWSGLRTNDGELSVYDITSLAEINDKGSSFDVIADIIEREF